MLQPASRYMEDIPTPITAARPLLADALTKHYAHHPALLAVGYDNEIGNALMSYSPADRLWFIDWVKAKYGQSSPQQGLGDAAMMRPSTIGMRSNCPMAMGRGRTSETLTFTASGRMKPSPR